MDFLAAHEKRGAASVPAKTPKLSHAMQGNNQLD
jgi:hypothetical protein